MPTLIHEQFGALEDFLKQKDNPALLTIQTAYYTGLRIGEVCGLTWQVINLDGQYPHGTAEHPLQRGEAQDEDRGHQAEEGPDCGLL